MYRAGRLWRQEWRKRNIALHRPSEAEINHPRAPVFAKQDIVRLEVAVQEACRVGRRQTAARLDKDRHDFLYRPRLFTQPTSERASLDIFHHHEDLIAPGAYVIHTDHIRVRKPGHRLSFAEDSEARVRIDAVGSQELNCHLSIELWIIRRVNDAHPAAAESSEQHVVVQGESGLALLVHPRWRKGCSLLPSGVSALRQRRRVGCRLIDRWRDGAEERLHLLTECLVATAGVGEKMRSLAGGALQCSLQQLANSLRSLRSHRLPSGNHSGPRARL